MANGMNSNQQARWRARWAALVKTALEAAKEWRQYAYPLVLVSLMGGLGITVAVLINPSTYTPNLPLSEDDVGRVASTDIRAPLSFTVPDMESTVRKQREAEDMVRAVYDWDLDLGEEVARRVKDAFSEVALVISGFEGDGSDNGGQGAPRRASPRKKAPDERGKREPLPPALDAKLTSMKGSFVRKLQVMLSEEDYGRLKADRVSTSTQSVVLGLLERTMGHMVIPSREMLVPERDRGVAVRIIKDGIPRSEQIINSYSKIIDVEEAVDLVEREAALKLLDISAELRTTQVHLSKSLITANLLFNRIETERRRKESRESIQPLEIRIKKGAMIVRDGDLIEKQHVRVFQEMQKYIEVSNSLELVLGTVLLVVLLLSIAVRFASANLRAFTPQYKDYLLIELILFIFVVTIKLWSWVFGAIWERFQVFSQDSFLFAIPFAAGAMLIRFVLKSEMALLFTMVASMLAGMLMGNSLGFALYSLVGSLVACWTVASAKQRTSLLKAGALTGLVNMGLAVGLSLSASVLFSFETLYTMMFAFGGGILSAMIVTTTAPIIEVLFGYTTDIKLLELANLNHPLLKDLIVQAPGSYHHSIIVGSMVEAAAETIHANSLLARVMAYYHDIGKVKIQHYFSENQRDNINPHDKLKPSLSATVLKTHVKDGAELARASHLGQPIVDAILQHHGTSLIKYFHKKAKDVEDPANPVSEEEFRYPGPKPQSREVALVMLADSVEAAAKSISDPSPARLQGLVQNIINRIFSDGQLNECDLTLKDLHDIARAFNLVLSGIYHHRPDYPESVVKDRDASDKKIRPIDKREKEATDKRLEVVDEKPDEDLKRLGI